MNAIEKITVLEESPRREWKVIVFTGNICFLIED
jgi:hypothetical protein